MDTYRSNEATIKDAFSSPRIDEYVDPNGLAKIFSSLDFNNVYKKMFSKKKD